MGHVAAGWRLTEVGGNGAKQANFLQKLYDFLSLDPHPCPEVIYWASNSKQLVVAQPDKLVKEILPKLFKHDKLSSFGRQLNIYGFTRQFPGRQFKDSGGKISDASVWAHPTLHRLSSFEDIASIKRRAAPKLFRTRRLANGQIVRTRAGPAVEAKFREVRESIAESRRRRGSLASIYSESTEQESLESHYLPVSTQEPDLSPIMPIPSIFPPGTPLVSAQTPVGRVRNASAGSLGEHKPRLADIHEDFVADDVTPPSLFFASANNHNAPPHGSDATHQGDHETQRTMRTMSNVSMAFDRSPTAPAPIIVSPHVMAPVVSTTVSASVIERKLQSCPASIHTTPIPAYMSLQQAGVELAKPHQPYNMTSTSPLTQTGSLGLIHIDTVQAQIDPQTRVNSAPRAADYQMTPTSVGSAQSFHHSFDLGQYGPRDSWASLASSMPARLSDTIPPYHIVGREFHLETAQSLWPAQIQAALERTATYAHFDPRASIQEVPMPLTIDPRWVSPGTSTNTTPAQTPGLQFSNPFENATKYVSPVDPVPQRGVDDHAVEPMQVDLVAPRQDYGLTFQAARDFATGMGTQSYPPGQGGRRRMEFAATSVYS